MKLCVIIAEYNPFHRGHKEQIEYIRGTYPDTAIAVIMSGNMVQRGETAVIDKYKRAEAAVRCGADLVLELPYPYCCASAGYFASSAVSIAEKIGADMLCFGSECGDIDLLKEVAFRTLSEEYIVLLESMIQQGKNSSESYISLYRRAYKELYDEEIPEGANNTLAIEYLRALSAIDSNIIPVTNKRTSPYSATVSRRLYRENDPDFFAAVPSEIYDIYMAQKPCLSEAVSDIILWYFRNSDVSELCGFADVDAGLASRLISCAGESAALGEFYARAATKKYTDSRVRRATFNCLLGVEKAMLEKEPVFSTLLAANSTGCKALREIKRNALIPIITKPADYASFGKEVEKAFIFSNKADVLFASAKGEKSADVLRKTPIII